MRTSVKPNGNDEPRDNQQPRKRSNKIKSPVDVIKQINSYIDMDVAYVGTLVKMLGITYVAEFSSSICKDAGYQTIAQQIEIFGKLAILVLSMPVLLALLDMIRGFLT